MSRGAIALIAALVGCTSVHVARDAGRDAATEPPADAIPIAALDGEWWYSPVIVRASASPRGRDDGAASSVAPFEGALGALHESAPLLERVRFEIGDELIARSVRNGDVIAAFPAEREGDALRVEWSADRIAPRGIFGASLEEHPSMVRYERRTVPADPSDPAIAPRAEGSYDYLSAGSAERWECEPGCDAVDVVRRHVFMRVVEGYAAVPYYADDQERFALQFTPDEPLRGQQRIWERSLDGRACAADADCPASICDPIARRCAIPLAERTPRRVVLALDADYPDDLVPGAFEAVAQWNEAFMAAQRAIEGRAFPSGGAPIECQADDPTRYCFCGSDAYAAEVDPVARTCRPRTDWFTSPDARGQDDPYDCWIERTHFLGSECRVVLEAREVALDELRASTLRFVPDASFCAIAQPRLDPITGEIVTASMHVGGGCLDELEGIAGELWPVLRGERPEGDIFLDPSFDGYYERIARNAELSGEDRGTTLLPFGLRDPAAHRIPVIPALDDPEFAPLERVDPSLEAAWMEPFLEGAMARLERDDPVVARDVVDPLASFSLLRGGAMRQIVNENVRDELLAHHLVFRPRFAHYAASYQRWWANAFARAPAEEAQARWRRALHRAFATRLVGHALGLAPNLAASVDRDHYPDGWFDVALDLPLPRVYDYDDDGDTIHSAAELTTWRRAYDDVRHRRLDFFGLGNASSSSVLDVHGDLSDLAGTGRYDRAAIAYGYFDLAEVVDDEAPREGDIVRSDLYPRSYWRAYAGGEPCTTDADCPYSRGSAGLAPGQPTHQRCMQAEYELYPMPCDGAPCACSRFDFDALDYVEGFGPYEDPAHTYVPYRSCAPGDTARDGICNLDDAGESMQDVAANLRHGWRELYPFTHGTRAGPPSPAARYLLATIEIAQQLLHRYFSDPDFRRTIGPLGFADFDVASALALDWLAEMVALPEAGDYLLDPDTGRYTPAFREPPAPGLIALPPGLGFRSVEWDRARALAMISQRTVGLDAGLGSALPLRDLYEIEVRELHTEIVRGELATYVVIDRDGDVVVVHPARRVGLCRVPTTGVVVPCRDALGPFDGATPLSSDDLSLRRFAGAFAMVPSMRGVVWPRAGAPAWPYSPECAVPGCAGQPTHAIWEDWIASAWPLDDPESYARRVFPEVGFALLAGAIARDAEIAALDPSDPRLARLRAERASDQAIVRDLAALATSVTDTWVPQAP